MKQFDLGKMRELAAEHLSAPKIALELGTTAHVVKRALIKHKIERPFTTFRFSKADAQALREAAIDMKPTDAVEALLDLFEFLIPNQNLQNLMTAKQRFPQFTRMEASILLILEQRIGEAVSKAMMFEMLYADRQVSSGEIPEEKIVDIYVCKIRGKLKKFNLPYRIDTSWGYGYSLHGEAH
jgi:hypothetical protein